MLLEWAWGLLGIVACGCSAVMGVALVRSVLREEGDE